MTIRTANAQSPQVLHFERSTTRGPYFDDLRGLADLYGGQWLTDAEYGGAKLCKALKDGFWIKFFIWEEVSVAKSRSKARYGSQFNFR